MCRFEPGESVTDRPRLTSGEFPPYSYVTGHQPHPVTDPAGHSHGQSQQSRQTLDPDHWAASSSYLWGIDLFNHGYYWEAHEAWEELWHAAGRRGIAADFLKALIKLAAAGVKAREGKRTGVIRHTRRAAELFESVADNHGADSFAGLSLLALRRVASELQDDADDFVNERPTLLLRQMISFPAI